MDNDSYGLGSGQPNVPNPGQAGPEHFRTVLILAILVAVAVIVAVIFTISSNRSQKVASVITPEPTVQASSSPGAATTPTPGAQPPAQPAYSGFDSLLNDGLSSDQENDAEFAFVKYARARGINVTQVTLDPATLTIALHVVNPTTNTASFNVQLNNSVEYEAKLNYSGLTAAELILIDPTSSAQVYDSGTIDVYNGIGDN